MNQILDSVQNYKQYIPQIIIAMCVIALIFGVVMMLMISIFGGEHKPKPKKQEILKKRARDLKEAFENLEKEEIPFYADYISWILVWIGALKIGPIMNSFFQVMRILKQSTFERNWRYRLPFYLMLGPEKSGKSTLLNGLSLMHLPGEKTIHENTWHLFDSGVIFEVPSNIFFEKDGTFWNFLLKVFTYFRPRRPLDGVIMTIPAEWLDNNHQIEISHYAREAVFKISTLQNVINFRVPIYLIVTKADTISGFSDFCSEFSPSEKGQIVGWSSTEKLDSGIQSNWMENALNEVSTGLRKASLSFARTCKISPTLKNAIFIKTGVDAIIKDLHDFIAILMKQRDETLYLCLRGIYFVAQNKTDPDNSSQMQMSALDPSSIENRLSTSTISHTHYGMCFADDLFQEKIFKEMNIAHPINMSTLQVSRETWIKRGIAIALSITWTISWHFGNARISQEVKSAEGILRTATSLMRKINVIENDIRDKTDQEILKQETKKLLQLISNINKDNMFSFFVPASWFSTVQTKISSVIGLLFDSSATRTVFLDLNINAKMVGKITVPKKKKSAKTNRNPFDVSTSDAFINFSEFVEKIVSLERMEVDYNRIRRLDDPEAINTLTKEIFKETFDITQMLQNRPSGSRFTAPQFNLENFQDQLQRDSTKLFKKFLDEIFNDTINKVFEKLCEDIEQLAYASKRTKEPYTADELIKLHGKLRTLSKLVDSNSFAWLREKSFNPNENFISVMSSVETSKILGHDISKNLLDMASKRFTKLRQELTEYTTSLTGPIFDEENLVLSDGVNKFTKELTILTNEDFVKPAFQKQFETSISADQMLMWDVKIVNEASEIVKNFNDFIDNRMRTISEERQNTYVEILRKIVYPRVVSILARAQNFEDFTNGSLVKQTENQVKKQVANLRNLSKHVPRLASFFDSYIDRGGEDSGFANLLIDQCDNVLKIVDSLFKLQSPYAVGNSVFSGWNGESGPNFANGNDGNNLRQYLASQYRRLSFLAKELAAPVIDILDSPGIANKVSTFDRKLKWTEILAKINDFDNNVPGNSIAALEEFMANLSNSATSANVQNDASIAYMANETGDYFVSQRAQIAKSLLSRASDINLKKAYDAYQSIVDFFNQALSGRFPFGSAHPEDCNISTVKTFIELYESFDINIADILKANMAKRHIPGNVIEFIDNLPTLIEFLKAWAKHSEDTDPQNALVAFRFETRSNIEKEIHGNVISERTLSLNGVAQDDDTEVIVHIGDTIDVEIPFVISNHEMELEPSTKPGVTVSGNKVIFSYSGDWSVVKLIQEHRTTPNVHASVDGALLEFAVPVSITETAHTEEAKVFMKAKVFIRVPGGSWRAISMPVFPESAPVLPPINI